jgi:hypothetical protein
LNPNSAELLFECYDKSKIVAGEPKFLGLGLVGIDELSCKYHFEFIYFWILFFGKRRLS